MPTTYNPSTGNWERYDMGGVPSYAAQNPWPTATGGNVIRTASGYQSVPYGSAAYGGYGGGYGGGLSPGSFAVNPSYANLTKASQKLTQANIAATQAAREAATPGATEVARTLGTEAQQLAAGQLPVDVVNLIGQRAAERGISSGGNVNADFLKALGLTSLQAMGQGADIYGRLSATPTAPIYQAGELVTTPYQQAGLAQQERQMQMNYQLEQQRLAQQAAEAQAARQQEAINASLRNWGSPVGGPSGISGGYAPTYAEPGYAATPYSTLFGYSGSRGYTAPASPDLYENLPTGNMYAEGNYNPETMYLTGVGPTYSPEPFSLEGIIP